MVELAAGGVANVPEDEYAELVLKEPRPYSVFVLFTASASVGCAQCA